MNVPFKLFSRLASTRIISRNYAFKSDLKIKWVRPEKIPCYKPEKSGDLASLSNLDLSQPMLKFRNCKELEDADERVKKLFSLEYAPKREINKIHLENIKEKTRRHQFDAGSVEVQIARWTGVIRVFQEIMELFPRDKRLKVVLKELIDKRKRKLKYLRRWDYKKFEWLLEKLDLVYKPFPNEIRPVTRKDSLRKLTDKYCTEIRDERLQSYKAMLEAEQPIFLEEKIRALEFIQREQKECGVEVTLSDEEIEAIRQQLQELQAKKVKIVED